MSRLEEALKRSGSGELFGGTSGDGPTAASAPPVLPVRDPEAISHETGEPAGLTTQARFETAPASDPMREDAAGRQVELTAEPGPVATAAGVAEKVVVDADTNPASVEQYVASRRCCITRRMSVV